MPGSAQHSSLLQTVLLQYSGALEDMTLPASHVLDLQVSKFSQHSSDVHTESPQTDGSDPELFRTLPEALGQSFALQMPAQHSSVVQVASAQVMVSVPEKDCSVKNSFAGHVVSWQNPTQHSSTVQFSERQLAGVSVFSDKPCAVGHVAALHRS
jgi:hypothetical protein